MKIIMENLIVSVRVLTGAFVFMLFLVAGVLANAEPHVLLIGGIITWFLGYIIGMAIANIIQQIDKENQFHPIERKEDHEKEIGQHVDFLQKMEMPRSK